MTGNYLWILDNGHGKATPGKRSPELEAGNRLFEYEFNRAIVARLIEKLEEAGLNYHNLVPETEGDITLKERVSRANGLDYEGKKLYVSIHGNAAGNGEDWHNAHGLETFHHPNSSNGKKMAAVFQKHLANIVGWRDRGVKNANFYVLRKTSMPAVLSENGFFTNREECVKMLSSEWRNKIAEAHFQAITEIDAGQMFG